jgi:hypothetical protein
MMLWYEMIPPELKQLINTSNNSFNNPHISPVSQSQSKNLKLNRVSMSIIEIF